MRVLLTAAPMVGHVLPLVPLPRAFRDAGHEVLMATATDGGDAARKGGLPAAPSIPGWVAARGVGPAVPARDITAETLGRLVSDPGLAAAAAEVAAEIAAMPPPGDLVAPLLDGVRARR